MSGAWQERERELERAREREREVEKARERVRNHEESDLDSSGGELLDPAQLGFVDATKLPESAVEAFEEMPVLASEAGKEPDLVQPAELDDEDLT